MREHFPTKRRGDPLEAEHVNRLSDVARRFARYNGDGFPALHGKRMFYLGPELSLGPHVVEVSGLTVGVGDTANNTADTADSGLYLVRRRYYVQSSDLWLTDSKDWTLDARDLFWGDNGATPALAVGIGDRFMAYWDEQRGMFVPTLNTPWLIARTGAGGIPARSGSTPGSATVTLYKINSSGALAAHQIGSPLANVTRTCYNLSTTAVAANTYIQITRETISGKLLAVWESC